MSDDLTERLRDEVWDALARIEELETALREIREKAVIYDKEDIARITLIDEIARRALGDNDE